MGCSGTRDTIYKSNSCAWTRLRQMGASETMRGRHCRHSQIPRFEQDGPSKAKTTQSKRRNKRRGEPAVGTWRITGGCFASSLSAAEALTAGVSSVGPKRNGPGDALSLSFFLIGVQRQSVWASRGCADPWVKHETWATGRAVSAVGGAGRERFMGKSAVA